MRKNPLADPIHRHLKTSETVVCLEGCLEWVFYEEMAGVDTGGPVHDGETAEDESQFVVIGNFAYTIFGKVKCTVFRKVKCTINFTKKSTKYVCLLQFAMILGPPVPTNWRLRIRFGG